MAVFTAFLEVVAVAGAPITSAQTAPAATGATTTTVAGGATATSTAVLEQQIDSNDQQIAQLNQQIAQYQAELQQVGANKKTLQAAINALDLQKSKVQAQVAVTQSQINITQLQIQQIGGEITDTEATIASDEQALGQYLVNLQKDDNQPLIMEVLSSNTLADAWTDTNATLQVEEAVQSQLATLQSQETALANSKSASQQKQATLASQQQSLAAQQQTLAQTVASKNQLLAVTNQQESTYEQLLAQAEAELNSFSAFTQNAGGSKLLAGQTDCDAWGCYYNQRDALWGNLPLDGTQYTMAADGCLVTAMAMVLTHYGYKDVTPETINQNPNDFAPYYPAYLLTSINVDGATATRKTTTIDATLATGNPVIVGLNAYGGTHFVVLVSGSKGNYIMRDPYITDGDDISFSAHYSIRSIFAITKVVISA
jgi:peptidoglycan hydrolase CwlO-like protein